MTNYNYSVTFENATAPCRTATGVIVGSAAGAVTRRAFNAAKEQLEGKIHWRSVVVVLEKADSSSESCPNDAILGDNSDDQ